MVLWNDIKPVKHVMVDHNKLELTVMKLSARWLSSP